MEELSVVDLVPVAAVTAKWHSITRAVDGHGAFTGGTTDRPPRRSLMLQLPLCV